VSVSPENIDITVELTFYEMPSLSERRRMDRDLDNAISDDERAAYLKGLAEQVGKGLSLAVDGEVVDVMVLYEPELDLLGVSEVSPSHHVLRLYYFARTPIGLKADSELVVKDVLWSNLPALRSAEAVGDDGFEVLVRDDCAVDPNRVSPVHIRCLSVPQREVLVSSVAPTAGADVRRKVSFASNPVWMGVSMTGVVVVAAVGLAWLLPKR
jgi:hypothetical protein